MFKKARIKLSMMYLAIVMAISIGFSVFIYRMVSFEIRSRMFEIGSRLYIRQGGFPAPPEQGMFFIDDIKETESKVLFVLIYTNVTILVLTSFAAYFLAGMTLRPIEEAMEEQKRFIADASHELKTPLTALQTSIEVALRDKKINLKEALFTLNDSLKDVKSLTVLTNDLLSLTRYQQNGLKESFQKVNLGLVIDESVAKILPIAKSKKINLKVNSSDSIIKGNRESLAKLVTIFLDNAIKYTPEKGRVEVENITKGRNAIIKVTDTGIGINKKEVQEIFERFYRADASRSKTKASGFGLGLSIAKSIIDIHKGSIDVESEVGKGSTFTVKLPIE
jgi:signal transduction histidine kinase